MSRRVVWLQLLIGWLPIWGLFTSIIVTVHHLPVGTASLISLRMIVAAAALGLVVQRLTDRMPWPAHVRPAFVLLHLVAGAVYSIAWFLLNSVIESVVRGSLVLVVGIGISSFLVVGVWLYVMIAGVSYATQSTERAARAEANAARAQLTALRSQLNPHFLFNALHTVVQLIPREPRRATEAAEQLGALLRTTIEEDRDEVSLAEELAVVERYLDLERIRFGDRLRVRVEVSDDARDASVPSFAVQTLVENAVRHGVAPRIDPTDVTVYGNTADDTLTVTVEDTGAGTTAEHLAATNGTGLVRLRDRLRVLYAGAARLDVLPRASGGMIATLVIPQERPS